MIESGKNRFFKAIRRLRQCKDESLVLLEGPHLVGEAVASGLELEWVVLTAEFAASAAGAALVERLPTRSRHWVEPRLLASVADSDSPQGIVAAARWRARSLETLTVAADSLWVLVDGVQDPGNLGAIVRVAEATGASAVLTTPGTASARHPRAVRASAGSLLRLPLVETVAVTALLAPREVSSPRLAALVPRGGRSIYDCDLTGSLVVAVGAEGRGLDPAIADAAELKLTIPLAATVESLNVAVAAAVVLFERQRQRQAVSS